MVLSHFASLKPNLLKPSLCSGHSAESDSDEMVRVNTQATLARAASFVDAQATVLLDPYEKATSNITWFNLTRRVSTGFPTRLQVPRHPGRQCRRVKRLTRIPLGRNRS